MGRNWCDILLIRWLDVNKILAAMFLLALHFLPLNEKKKTKNQKQNTFIIITFTCFVSFSISLLVLIILGQFWWFLRSVENVQNSKVHGGYKIIITLCGQQRKHIWTYHVPTRFHCPSLNVVKTPTLPHPQPPRVKNAKAQAKLG